MSEEVKKMEQEAGDKQEKPKQDSNETQAIEVDDVEIEEETPFLDLSNHCIKPDMFDGIHILDDSIEKIEGAPNFRQIAGFPVFGTGQPTEGAMVEIINRAKMGKENEKIIWFVMRQEPIIYINGNSFAPRDPDNTHVNLQTKMDSDQIKSVESHLVKVVKRRKNESGNNTVKIKIDLDFAENPMDRGDDEDTLVIEEIKDLDSVYKYCREKCNVNLEVIRIPVVEDQMPVEYMDAIIDALKNESASTPCIFNCQMGKGRTSIGMVAACLIKEIILTAELR